VSTVVTSVARPVGRPAPLRLTRRGRAVVLALFIVLTSLAGALLLATASRASDPSEAAAPTVVVRPYDTLWAIAARTQPGRSPREAVAEIRRMNGLDDYLVHPGQTLVLPPRR
jgi:hypothetical protein